MNNGVRKVGGVQCVVFLVYCVGYVDVVYVGVVGIGIDYQLFWLLVVVVVVVVDVVEYVVVVQLNYVVEVGIDGVVEGFFQMQYYGLDVVFDQ